VGPECLPVPLPRFPTVSDVASRLEFDILGRQNVILTRPTVITLANLLGLVCPILTSTVSVPELVQYQKKGIGADSNGALKMNNGFGGDLFETQRRLRTQLLDHKTIRYVPSRDLAAHMLLHLDDLKACWSVATHWLRAELGCHRVDTGFGVRHAHDYFPGFAQAKHTDFDVPTFGGKAVDNRDPAMQAMWSEAHPLIFADIKHDSRITMSLRQRLSGSQTKSKFAWALRNEKGSYGLICADWTEHLAPWESGLYDCFEQTVADVLCPIIRVAKDIDDHTIALASQTSTAPLATLTSSELEVAKLVARGLSYKEVARMRGRSFSTIDHQLRSIREKIGVSSTSELVSHLAKLNALSN
jgi:DNA-binding CsgD family transcriptional regulator